MDNKQIYRYRQQAIHKMDGGDLQSALNLARKIQSFDSNYIVSYEASGLLIDIGADMGSETIIKEGVELLEKDFETIVSHNEYAQTAYYNRANGYYALFHLERINDPYLACFNKTKLDQAKVYYRHALNYGVQDPMLTSQILVNLGNSFDHLGRVVEALECYEKALKWKPDHGMALGNKGQALLYYAHLMSEHQGTILAEAYKILHKALDLGVTQQAAVVFKQCLKTIRKSFSDERILENPPEFPGITIKGETQFEKFMIENCLKNKLYLNFCNYCQKCDAAIGDQVVIKKMIVTVSKDKNENFPEDEPFIRLSSYLNEIKQDYVTARFLLILSRYKRLNLDFVDRRVRIIDTLDYTMHNVYIQLVKSSFRSFYDIFDKIASFLNYYLELGIPDKRINFRIVWYENWKHKNVYKKIADSKNFSLNALFDIHRDFEHGPYEKLRQIRNALSHRFVKVRMFQGSENEQDMKEETIVNHTLELARLVRSAIIYLLCFVDLQERKKGTESKGASAPLFALDVPDDLKSVR